MYYDLSATDFSCRISIIDIAHLIVIDKDISAFIPYLDSEHVDVSAWRELLVNRGEHKPINTSLYGLGQRKPLP